MANNSFKVKNSLLMESASSASILWGTDAGGVIGSFGSARPNRIYSKNNIIVGTSAASADDADVTYIGNNNNVVFNVGGNAGNDDRAYWTFSNTVDNIGMSRKSNSDYLDITRINGGTPPIYFRFNLNGEFRMNTATGANILWNTDGGGTIGADAATRPTSIYAKSFLHIGNNTAGFVIPTIDALSLTTESSTRYSAISNTFFGSGGFAGGGAGLSLRSARGTQGSPSATQNGDDLGYINFGGYNGTSFSNSNASIQASATQNWSVGSNGSTLYFRTTANGSGSSSIRWTVGQNGDFTGDFVKLYGGTPTLLVSPNLATGFVDSTIDALALTTESSSRYSAITNTFFGAGGFAGGPAPIILRNARGTQASPTATQSTDGLGIIRFEGYGTSFGIGATILAEATQTWTGSARGSSITFRTVPNGSTTVTSRWLIDQDGGLKAATDGDVNIGASATNRPDSAFLKTLLQIGNPAISGDGFSLSSNTLPILGVNYYAGDNSAPRIRFRKARGSFASPTAAQSGDGLGVVEVAGYNGSGFSTASKMIIEATETFNGSGAGSDFLFLTVPNGSLSPVDRFKIANDGSISMLSASGANILWNTDAGGNIGASAGSRPDNLYVKPSAGSTGDAHGRIGWDSGTFLWGGTAGQIDFHVNSGRRAFVDSNNFFFLVPPRLSSVDLQWSTDGGGNIGQAAALRPEIAYIRAAVHINGNNASAKNFSITGGTLDATFTRVGVISGSIPNTAASFRGMDLSFSTTGTLATRIIGQRVALTGTYSGSDSTRAMEISHESVAGTGTLSFSNPDGNYGLTVFTAGTTDMAGIFSQSYAGQKNWGIIGQGLGNNSSSNNVGINGSASIATAGSPKAIGVFARIETNANKANLYSTDLSSFFSSALAASNGTTTSGIAAFYDNTTLMWSFADGGNLLTGTDGGANIGNSSSNRPNHVYAVTSFTIDSTTIKNDGTSTFASANTFGSGLNITGSGSDIGLNITNTGTGGDDWHIWVGNNSSGGSPGRLNFYNGSNTPMSIGDDGVAFAKATFHASNTFVAGALISLEGTSAADIMWVTDGGGNIGGSSANRPDKGYFKTELQVFGNSNTSDSFAFKSVNASASTSTLNLSTQAGNFGIISTVSGTNASGGNVAIYANAGDNGGGTRMGMYGRSISSGGSASHVGVGGHSARGSGAFAVGGLFTYGSGSEYFPTIETTVSAGLIGHSANPNGLAGAFIYNESGDQATYQIGSDFFMKRWRDDQLTTLRMSKSRGSYASPTALTSAYEFARIVFNGQTSSSTASDVSYIKAITTQAFTTGARGNKIVFGTTANGSTTIVDNWQISDAGHLQAVTDGAVDIGASAANRPNNIYAAANIVSDGDLIANVIGKGLRIKTGTNSRNGVATLVGGTVTVSNTSVTANTAVILTKQSTGTPVALGSVSESARVANTSFTITSDNVLDTSDVAWVLVERV